MNRSAAPRLLAALLPLLGLLLAAPLAAQAEEPAAGPPTGAVETAADTLRERLRLPVPPPPPPHARAPRLLRMAPGISASSPVAFGAGWGDVYLGAGYQARARYVRKPHDGALAAGFGLGNPRRLVGLEVDVISFSTLRSGWGSRMGVDLKLHRLLTPNLAVAAGHESVLLRGETDGGASRYGVVSGYFPLRESHPSALALSLGVGDGRFLSEQEWARGTKSANLFGSAALRVVEPASLILDWTGQDLAVGVSLVPLRRLPLVVTPAMLDLTGSAGDGARFGIAAALAHRFGSRF